MKINKTPSITNKINHAYLRLGTFFVLSLMNLNAFAAPSGGLSLGKVGENVAGQMSGLTKGILYSFATAGVLLVGFGTMKWQTSRNNQEDTPKEAIKATAIGSVLLAIPIIITLVNVSFFGSDASAKMQNSVITSANK